MWLQGTTCCLQIQVRKRSSEDDRWIPLAPRSRFCWSSFTLGRCAGLRVELPPCGTPLSRYPPWPRQGFAPPISRWREAQRSGVPLYLCSSDCFLSVDYTWFCLFSNCTNGALPENHSPRSVGSDSARDENLCSDLKNNPQWKSMDCRKHRYLTVFLPVHET